MSVYSPKINTSIVMDGVLLSTSVTSTPLDSVDSDSDLDQPLHLHVSNPDTSGSNEESSDKTQSPLNYQDTYTSPEPQSPEPAALNIPDHPMETIQGFEQEKRPYHLVKALPPITSTRLERRQSKTEHDDTESRPSFYAISETVEYQPHQLRASILEPISKTINPYAHQPTIPENASSQDQPTIPEHAFSQDQPNVPEYTATKDDTLRMSDSEKQPPSSRIRSGNELYSHSLIHNPGAIKLYRAMAEKTQDEKVQLGYAEYLLASATHGQKKSKALQEEGVRWIRRLSKKGVGKAAMMEAMWMETEQYGYTARQGSRVDRLYHIAIQAGVPDASYRLGLRQEKNGAPAYDVFRLIQRAADLDCILAIYRMAKIYLYGELGLTQDYTKGMAYLVSAAQNATPDCNEPPYCLALILTHKHTKVTVPSEFLKGYGGMAQVVDYMAKSADLGHVGAKNRLATILEHGSGGVPVDIARAFMYYQQAAAQGHLQAMLGLGRLYHHGCHGPDDTPKQDPWYASHPKDPALSFSWCQRAAQGGLPDALYVLGWYYEIGWGVPVNNQYAQEYYRQAARKGQAEAKDRLRLL